MQLYGRRVTISREEVAREIEDLCRRCGSPSELSVHVELRLWCDGHTSLEVVQESIYEGFTLRCFNPYATCQIYDNPFGDYPTSARRAVSDWAHHKSREEGADVAIRVGRDGVVYSCYDSPLFGVKGSVVLSSPMMSSVERSMVIYAAQRCGYEFVQRAIRREELERLDEIFWVDAYGITAIAQVGDRRYMSIVAEKIAQQMR